MRLIDPNQSEIINPKKELVYNQAILGTEMSIKYIYNVTKDLDII